MISLLKRLSAMAGGAAIVAATVLPAPAADVYRGGSHAYRYSHYRVHATRLGYGYGGYGRRQAEVYGPVSGGGYGYGYVGTAGVPFYYGGPYPYGYYQYPVGYGAGAVPYGYGYGTGNLPQSGLYGLGY